MRLLRTRWFIAVATIVLLGVPGTWLLARGTGPSDESVVARAKRGEFKVTVTTAGELRARKFVEITLPPNSQQAEVYQMKISSLVPEGTVVKEGDVVAELDRSTVAPKLAEVTLALQKAQAQFQEAMLDSTLDLSKAREDMRTMELGLEEKKIAKEQAVYEAPSVRRQAEIDYEKADRALAQAKLDYTTKTAQAVAKMSEASADLERQKSKLQIVETFMGGFTIKAPSSGMVIYVKEWNGKKRAVGSQVSGWDPAVATLPDLTQMESITYVNEIDVRKIAVGQPVVLTLDADPSKKLKGTVVSVANVGEQRPNADAKVFEVKVNVEQPDTTLRPGMTTGNAVETYRIKDVVFIPIEAVSSEGGVAYVYKRSGTHVVKQEVETGAMNDDEVVIVRGLQADDPVLLSPPPDRDKLTPVRLPGSGAPPPSIGGDTAVHKALNAPAHAPATSAPVKKDSPPAPRPTHPELALG